MNTLLLLIIYIVLYVLSIATIRYGWCPFDKVGRLTDCACGFPYSFTEGWCNVEKCDKCHLKFLCELPKWTHPILDKLGAAIILSLLPLIVTLFICVALYVKWHKKRCLVNILSRVKA